jgi:hypothetical protein
MGPTGTGPERVPHHASVAQHGRVSQIALEPRDWKLRTRTAAAEVACDTQCRTCCSAQRRPRAMQYCAAHRSVQRAECAGRSTHRSTRSIRRKDKWRRQGPRADAPTHGCWQAPAVLKRETSLRRFGGVSVAHRRTFAPMCVSSALATPARPRDHCELPARPNSIAAHRAEPDVRCNTNGNVRALARRASGIRPAMVCLSAGWMGARQV